MVAHFTKRLRNLKKFLDIPANSATVGVFFNHLFGAIGLLPSLCKIAKSPARVGPRSLVNWLSSNSFFEAIGFRFLLNPRKRITIQATQLSSFSLSGHETQFLLKLSKPYSFRFPAFFPFAAMGRSSFSFIGKSTRPAFRTSLSNEYKPSHQTRSETAYLSHVERCQGQ